MPATTYLQTPDSARKCSLGVEERTDPRATAETNDCSSQKKGKRKLALDQKLENEGVKEKKKGCIQQQRTSRAPQRNHKRGLDPPKTTLCGDKGNTDRGKSAHARRDTRRGGAGRERETLFYTVFPSFQSNGSDQMKSRSDGRYHTLGLGHSIVAKAVGH